MREKIKLESSAGTGHFYTTTKNKRTTPDKLEIRKYDPKARKHVIYKETAEVKRPARAGLFFWGGAFSFGALAEAVLRADREDVDVVLGSREPHVITVPVAAKRPHRKGVRPICAPIPVARPQPGFLAGLNEGRVTPTSILL